MDINDGFADCEERISGVDEFASIIHSSPYVVNVTDENGLSPNSYNFNQRKIWYVTAKERHGNVVHNHLRAIREEHPDLFEGIRFIVYEDIIPQTSLDNFIDIFYNTVAEWRERNFPYRRISSFDDYMKQGFVKIEVAYTDTRFLRELANEIEKQGKHVRIDIVKVRRGPDYTKISEREKDTLVTTSWEEIKPEVLVLA